MTDPTWSALNVTSGLIRSWNMFEMLRKAGMMTDKEMIEKFGKIIDTLGPVMSLSYKLLDYAEGKPMPDLTAEETAILNKVM